ncbi:MAG: hypothetical protein J0665_20570 [Deltaproteobacteria bacterium]|nr:hypothetical protein [Deltaproteobacteria bacterium]
MEYNLPNYPHLAAAMRLQRNRHKKRGKNSRLKMDDMSDAFGVLARAFSKDQFELFSQDRVGLVETIVLEHTADGLILPFRDERVPFPMDCSPMVKRVNFTEDIVTPDGAALVRDADSGVLVAGTEVLVRRLSEPDFDTGKSDFFVGYDTEFKVNDVKKFDLNSRDYIKEKSKLISHQFYFNFQGVRFGIVFLTDRQLSQTNFISIIDGAVPKIKNPEILKTVLVYAHFSVIESGWMRSSSRALQTPHLFNSIAKDIPLIHERNSAWHGYAPLREYTTVSARGKETVHRINLLFCDSMHLQAASLKKLGKDIDLDKVDLAEGVISRMDQFLLDDPKKFVEYAINDSIVTAEVHLHFYNTGVRLGIVKPGEYKTTMPAYSGAYFQGLFEQHYGPDWKRYLGYDSNGTMTDTCKMFIRFYHGGRNDCLQVGPRNTCHYLDIHSAYLSSLAMMPDYCLSDAIVAGGQNAEKLAAELMLDRQGPFQVAGIECTFRFKPCAKPIFPVRIDDSESLPGVSRSFCSDGIIYPMAGSSFCTWPEYWVAVHHGLLETVTVNRVTTFRRVHATQKLLPGSFCDETFNPGGSGDETWFASLIMNLIIRRSTSAEHEKLYIKNLLNFVYGKFSAGCSGAIAAVKNHDFSANFSGSSVTSFPLAATICGFTRATVGELLNFNPAFGITTDGFITERSRAELVTPPGGLCQMVQDSFTARGFTAKQFIGTEASGNCSIFLKTRGYAIIDTESHVDGQPPTPNQMLKKMAGIGLQVDKYKSLDPVQDFLEMIFSGWADKKYFIKLTKIRAEQLSDDAAVPERRTSEKAKVNMSFDMKHIPAGIEHRSITWAGRTYWFPSFSSVPLQTPSDFHTLRALRQRDHGMDLQVLWPGLMDDNFPKMTLTYTGDLDLPLSTGWDRLDFDVVLPEFVYTKDLIDSYIKERTGLPTDINFQMCGDALKSIGHVPQSKKTLDFIISSHEAALVELLIDMRELPTYMTFGDYLTLADRFNDFNGSSGTMVEINRPGTGFGSHLIAPIVDIDD